VPLGEIALTAVAPNNADDQQRIIFDPIPRVDGIEASPTRCSNHEPTFI